MAFLRIKTFGGFEAIVAPRTRVHLTNRKVAQVLACLATDLDRVWNRAVLAQTIWPESFADAALASLRQALACLRKDLSAAGVDPDTVFKSDRTSVAMLEGSVYVDAIDFTHTFESVKAAADPTRRVELLLKACSLFAGPFCPEFDSGWADEHRQRLGRLLERGLSELLELGPACGKCKSAVEAAHAALATDPLCEPLVHAVMRALMADNRPAEAVAQFRKYERLLKAKYDQPPSNQVVETARQAKREATRSVPLPPGNLPTSLHRYFGREAELDRCLADLRGPDRAVVALLGAGGIGKTRLSMELAHRASEDYNGAAWFVDFASVRNAEDIIGTILDSMEAERGDKSGMESFARLIGNKRALMVLDNLEQIGPGAGAVVQEAIERVPRLSLVLTSREPVPVRPIREVRLDTLPRPSQDDFDSNPGIGIFLDRSGFTPDSLAPEDRLALIDLIDKLEGLPLAICLAAAQATTLTPSQIVAGLDDRFRLLATTSSDFVARHKRLWACISWTHEMYPETHVLLQKLSVFRGGWTLDTASLASGGARINSLLQTLVRSSLAHETSRQGVVRFDMYESVREFVRTSLDETSHEQARENHARAMSEWITSDQLRFQKYDEGYIRTRAEDYENLRAAFVWGVNNDPGLSLKIVQGLAYYWWSREMFREGEDWANRAIEAHPQVTDVDYAMTYRVLAMMHTGQDEYEKAYQTLQRGMEFMPDDIDKVQLSRFLNTMGNACASFDPEQAIAHFEDGIGIAKETGDDSMLWSLTGNVGWALFYLGEFDRAEEHLTSAIEGSRRLGNPDWAGQMLHNSGLVARAKGDWAEAERRFAAACKEVEGHDVDVSTRGWLADAGVVIVRQGRLEEGLRIIKAGAGGILSSKGLEAYADTLEALAEYCAEAGDLEGAVAFLHGSISLGVSSQRSRAEVAPDREERLERLKSKLAPARFKSASKRFQGLTPTELIEEVLYYEPLDTLGGLPSQNER